VLEGVDKFNNLFGSVVYPEGDKLVNLGEALMQVRQGESARVCAFVCLLRQLLVCACVCLRQRVTKSMQKRQNEALYSSLVWVWLPGLHLIAASCVPCV
jgi:hypothetical protein